MKYAVVNKFQGINRVLDASPPPESIPAEVTIVEISDEMAAQVISGKTASPPVIYFLIDGALKTLQEKQEIYKQNIVHPMLPAWRIRAIAKMTPVGDTTLHQAILDIIDAVGNQKVKTAAKEAYLGGHVLDRKSVLLLQVAQQLGMTQKQIDNIFIQAAQLPS